MCVDCRSDRINLTVMMPNPYAFKPATSVMLGRCGWLCVRNGQACLPASVGAWFVFFMKHIFRCLSLYGLLWLCATNALADKLQPSVQESGEPHASQVVPISADEILRKALEARGGKDAAAHIQSYRCQGTADFAFGGRCDYECLATRSRVTREVFTFGGKYRTEFAFDGQRAWELPPGTAPELKSSDNLREYQDNARFFAWYDNPTNYQSVALLGETTFEGKKCYELKLVTKSGLEQSHYYNTSNYFLAGVVERVTTETGPTRLTTSFLEYRQFDGFWFPARFRRQAQEWDYVIRLNSIQVNKVNGSTVKMPESQIVQASVKSPASLSDTEIKTMLQDLVDKDKFGVGLVVGLIDSQGSRVFSYGRMDNETGPEVNGDTLFEIGSITKVFTRFLLYDMVAQGEMNLDDSVQKYLPPSVRMPTRRGKQITLWDLCTHTSGLPREMGGPWTVERLYAFLGSYKLPRDPGDQFEYSNIGISLLGHAISLKAGRDYETLVRERICRPLKMDNTVITLTPELRARCAVGHKSVNRTADYIGLQAIPGCGALFSTANDMLKLASATLGLNPCPLTPLMKKTDGGHNGGTYGFSSLLAFDPKQKRALVGLANCRDDDALEYLRPLLKSESPKPPQATPVSAETLEKCVGQYHAAGDRLRTVSREGDHLRIQEYGKAGCELFPLSETNFYNSLFDCRATFVPDSATGQARQLMVGDWRGNRISGQILPPAAAALSEADCLPRDDSDLQGVWKATVRPWYWPFIAVHVKVRIAEVSAYAFRSELDSPDFDEHNVPLGVIYNRPTVEVFGLSGEGWFQGKVNSTHTKVAGRWNLNGHSIRTTFRRVKQSNAVKK